MCWEPHGYRDTGLEKWWGEGAANQRRADSTLINGTGFKEREVIQTPAHWMCGIQLYNNERVITCI